MIDWRLAMEELVRQFEATAPDGEPVIILEYRPLKDILTTPDADTSSMYGRPRYTTANGYPVTKKSDGYQIKGQDKIYYESEYE